MNCGKTCCKFSGLVAVVKFFVFRNKFPQTVLNTLKLRFLNSVVACQGNTLYKQKPMLIVLVQ
jgi:hypothetical protein